MKENWFEIAWINNDEAILHGHKADVSIRVTPTNPTEAQMKLARECAAHGFPKDMPYYKNCMAGNYDEFGIMQAPLLAIQATEARAQGLVEALERVGSSEAIGIPFMMTDSNEAFELRERMEIARQALATWRRT